MWIRYTNEEYDELKELCELEEKIRPGYSGHIDGKLAKWIKKIVDANEEQESFGRRLH